jgi:dCTP diphosphatase
MSDDPFEELKKLVKIFIRERAWQPFHNPKNLAMSISIESAEIMELFQWYTNEEALEKVNTDPKLKLALEDELADVLIYCISMSNTCGIDLTSAIRNKLKTNEQRFPIERVSGSLGPYKTD